ncbi:phosphatase PAP2 family protein [Actinopolymorpha sp. B11F2]|uniref:phosphatase PAP2 family protein n=1 Tax=Actinopolymorpha sp. B11F2 TaxID=3160862 RepID=UPI0032E37EA3
MPSRTRWPLAVWLVLLAFAQVGALAVIWWVFVRTAGGQTLDAVALLGRSIGQTRVDGLVTRALNTITVVSVIAATVTIGFVALARRRYRLAVVATLLIVGANVTTQLLKRSVIERPDLGVEGVETNLNSLPSGHTTVAASMAVAAVLVLPPRLRGGVALAGTCYAALVGIATLAEGWHRPSDAVAAFLVVGAWSAAAGFVLVVTERESERSTPPSGRERHCSPASGTSWSDGTHPYALTLLFVAGLAMLTVAAVALGITDQTPHPAPENLSWRRLFAAYSGAAAGIAGTACMVMVMVLATVHHVVPSRDTSQPPGPSRRNAVTTGPH